MNDRHSLGAWLTIGVFATLGLMSALLGAVAAVAS